MLNKAQQKELRKCIKVYMAKHDLKQDGYAMEAKVSPQSISKIMNLHKIGPRTVHSVLTHLGIDYSTELIYTIKFPKI